MISLTNTILLLSFIFKALSSECPKTSLDGSAEDIFLTYNETKRTTLEIFQAEGLDARNTVFSMSGYYVLVYNLPQKSSAELEISFGVILKGINTMIGDSGVQLESVQKVHTYVVQFVGTKITETVIKSSLQNLLSGFNMELTNVTLVEAEETVQIFFQIKTSNPQMFQYECWDEVIEDFIRAYSFLSLRVPYNLTEITITHTDTEIFINVTFPSGCTFPPPFYEVYCNWNGVWNSLQPIIVELPEMISGTVSTNNVNISSTRMDVRSAAYTVISLNITKDSILSLYSSVVSVATMALDGILEIDSSVLMVDMDLNLVSSSVIIVGGISQNHITIKGCSYLSGTLQLQNFSLTELEGYLLWYTNCSEGQFTSIITEYSDTCYTTRLMIMGLYLLQTECSSSDSTEPEISALSITIIVLFFIFLIVGIVVVVEKVPMLREKIFPYRFRSKVTHVRPYHEMSS